MDHVISMAIAWYSLDQSSRLIDKFIEKLKYSQSISQNSLKLY